MRHPILPSNQRRAGSASAAGLVLALLAAGCSGKGVAQSCADVTACGGDPTLSSWLIRSACQSEVTPPVLAQVPIAAGYTTPQTPELATPPPSNVASGDWCQGLVYSQPSDPSMPPNAVVSLSAQPQDYQVGGTMTFDTKTGQYTASMRVQKDFAVHFTPACIQAHGSHPTCSQLTASIASYFAGGFVNYNDFMCTDASDSGCDCTYNYGEGTGETGRFAVVGSQIYIFDAPSGKPPHAMDFCIQGDTMTIAGHNGTHLFGSPGLRSLVMTSCSGATCNLAPVGAAAAGAGGADPVGLTGAAGVAGAATAGGADGMGGAAPAAGTGGAAPAAP